MMQPQATDVPRHKVQHWMWQGLQYLRMDLPEEVAGRSTTTELDEAILRLSPMEGLGYIPPADRMLALAHALRVLAEEVLPHVDPEKADLRAFPAMLTRIEEGLRAVER